MEVQILGTGCTKCKKLMANAEQAVREAGLDVHVEKVEDVLEIMKFQVMMTPALAVDGEVKAAGRVLSPEEIKKFLGV